MWSFYKCVFAGKDHIDENMPCQDYADYTITDKGIYVAALSDGASASAYSDIAASCNVNTAINLFHKYPFEKLFYAGAESIKKLVIESCLSAIFRNINRISGAKPIDFAATLLFMASDGKKALIGHIGDGVICSVDTMQRIEIISGPDNINSEMNRTYFSISKDAETHLSIICIDNIEKYSAIIMMSDGPETSFYDYTTKQMRSRNLLTITNEIGSERAREIELTYFMKTNFWEHGITGDDCSMVVFAKERDI